MTQPIAAPAWQSTVPKPPLTARQKGGARLAGVLGFLLLSLGWALFALPLAALAFGAFFALLFAGIQRASGDDGPIPMLEQLDLGAWVVPLVVVSAAGILITVAALFVSRAILRAHAVGRPWGVTFAGAGIAIVASWITSAVLALPLQFAGIFSDNQTGTPAALAVAIITGVIGLVGTAAIGFFAWWWMAHALRPAAAQPLA